METFEAQYALYSRRGVALRRKKRRIHTTRGQWVAVRSAAETRLSVFRLIAMTTPDVLLHAAYEEPVGKQSLCVYVGGTRRNGLENLNKIKVNEAKNGPVQFWGRASHLCLRAPCETCLALSGLPEPRSACPKLPRPSAVANRPIGVVDVAS